MLKTWMRSMVVGMIIPLAVACGEDEGPEEHADEVGFIRLTIGSQTVTINPDAAVGSFTIPVGSSSQMTATFLAPDNDVVTLNPAQFRLDVESLNPARVTFTRTGPFSGTLNGLSAGTATIRVSIFHIQEGHADFGPKDVTVNVAAVISASFNPAVR